jgi:hypothetical protein
MRPQHCTEEFCMKSLRDDCWTVDQLKHCVFWDHLADILQLLPNAPLKM